MTNLDMNATSNSQWSTVNTDGIDTVSRLLNAPQTHLSRILTTAGMLILYTVLVELQQHLPSELDSDMRRRRSTPFSLTCFLPSANLLYKDDIYERHTEYTRDS